MTTTEALVVKDCVYQLNVLVRIHAEGRWSPAHDQMYINILGTLTTMRACCIQRSALDNDHLQQTLNDRGIDL